MMSTLPLGGRSARITVVQVFVLVLLIGPQWLVMRDLFDGATVALAAALDNPDGLYFWLSNGNWLLAVLLFKLVFAISDVLAVPYIVVVKLAVTGLLLALYAEMVSLGRRLFALTPGEARLAGLLCMASPSLYVYVNSIMLPFLLCIWLMFLGHRLFWSDRLATRVAGLLVMALSFQLNSNLVLSLALEVAFIARFPSLLRARLKWFAALFAVAIGVYMTIRLIAPPRQIFVEYNYLLNPLDPDSLRRMVRAVVMFLTWGVIPLSVMAVIAAAAFALRKSPPAGASPAHIDWLGMAIAVFLCAAAAFPYVMVGKGPPLFTWVGYGNGLTEQILRAAHGGPLAPTWANTSGRHGLLYLMPLAFLCWLLARAVAVRMRGASLAPLAQFALVLPLFLVWVLPAYKNKMEMQFAEISLVNGLRPLPAAPAGVVYLRYWPVSDWVLWSNVSNGILREAWGSAAYYGIFYSVEAYREDVQWAYHAYFKGPGGMGSRVLQRSVGMDGFPGEDCQTRYEASLPYPGWLALLGAGFAPGKVPPAQVKLLDSKCVPGQSVPNPTPQKKAIL